MSTFVVIALKEFIKALNGLMETTIKVLNTTDFKDREEEFKEITTNYIQEIERRFL